MDKTVAAQQLAELFDVTTPTVYNWANKYGMPKEARGKFDVTKCINWKINHELRKSQLTLTDEDVTEQELELRKLSAETALKEIQVERERDTLTTHEAVKALLAGYLEPLRGALLQIPSTWPLELLGLEEKAEAQAILERLVDDLLRKSSATPTLPDFETISKIEEALEKEEVDG